VWLGAKTGMEATGLPSAATTWPGSVSRACAERALASCSCPSGCRRFLAKRAHLRASPGRASAWAANLVRMMAATVGAWVVTNRTPSRAAPTKCRRGRDRGLVRIPRRAQRRNLDRQPGPTGDRRDRRSRAALRRAQRPLPHSRHRGQPRRQGAERHRSQGVVATFPASGGRS